VCIDDHHIYQLHTEIRFTPKYTYRKHTQLKPIYIDDLHHQHRRNGMIDYWAYITRT